VRQRQHRERERERARERSTEREREREGKLVGDQLQLTDKSRQSPIRGCKIFQFMQIFALQITKSRASPLPSPLSPTPLLQLFDCTSAQKQQHRAVVVALIARCT